MIQMRFVLIATGFVASLLTAGTAAGQIPTDDVTGMSLRDLLDVEVISTASKFPQSVREAPASITVINAEDIRRFGYRTLADALKSVRGFYTTYDRNYVYVGMRGFARPGDYNTRILLLIDGQRLNDGIYDMAPVGTDSPVPMSLIERIEIIRGPGSSLYGSNALFGVVNVVTKTGGARKGFQVEGHGGSLGTHAATASYGRLFSNGSEVLVAAGGYRSRGQNRIHFPEFDGGDGSAGIAADLDHDDVSTFLASASAGRFSLRVTAVERHKQIPTASFGTVFGDEREETTDTRTSISGVYDGPLGHGWMGTGRVAYDYYGYRGNYPFDYGDDGLVVFEDLSAAHALTGEITARRRAGRIHQVTIGAEVRHHLQARQRASDVLAEYIDLDMPGTSVGVYVQDEVRVRPWLLLNAGARIDRFIDVGTRATPRAAAVLLPRARTAVKLLHGSAFRAPNVYERYYYNSRASLVADLKPEQIRSSELVWEESLSANVRASVSAFVYDVGGLIEQRESREAGTRSGIYFANGGGTRARGIEAEAEARLDDGIVARISHTFSRARDRATSQLISNSPAHLSKASVQVPLLGAAIAVEGHYVGERLTLRGEPLAGFFMSNVSVSIPAHRRLTIAIDAFNALNRSYSDPGAEEHVQSAIRQDGRTVMIRAGMRF